MVGALRALGWIRLQQKLDVRWLKFQLSIRKRIRHRWQSIRTAKSVAFIKREIAHR